MKRLAAALMVLSVNVAAPRADEAPDWLQTSLKRPVPATFGKTPILYLHREELLDLSKSEERSRSREAVRIMTIEGLRGFSLSAAQGLIQDFKLAGAWRVRPDGEVKKFDVRSIIQTDADEYYEFTMSKINHFHPDEVRVGDVIAWEYVMRSKLEAYQTDWYVGRPWPTLLARLGIRAPTGWEVTSMTRNHPGIPASKNDEGYTVWEARDVAAPKEEPSGIPWRESVPELLIRWNPPANETDARQFKDWASVGRWYAGIITAQVVTDGQIKRTASDLTAGTATKTDAIEAVARFVQGVRYLNVAAGRSTAEPHPAPQILKNRFGDCEDKAVLTITLLKEIGIEAFPMLALTSSVGSVAADFPAPNSFNHAIVAVKVPAETLDMPAGVEVDPIGRLVVFDPTNTTTGFGDLPGYLQGTRAVLAHETHGGLIPLPVLPPEASRRESEAHVSFPTRGGIDVKTACKFSGQYAADMRARYESVRGDKRKEEFLSWLSGYYGKAEVRGFDVSGVESSDQPIGRTIDLWMPLPGKDLGALRTMAASLHLFTQVDRFNETERTTPLRIDTGYMERDLTTIEIPSGWKVLDPLPAVEAASPAGSYSMKVRREGDRLLVERTLRINAITVPPSEYLPIKKFFDEVLKGDGTSIAMEKTAS